MEVYYGAEEADQRCANMVNEDMVERRPANRTPLPRHEPPIKARFNETITHFQKVITARHGESPAYLGQLRKELNIFNLWGDGLYASEGGLDKCLRNSEDLKKSVESRLDAIRDVLTRGNLLHLPPSMMPSTGLNARPHNRTPTVPYYLNL